MMQSNKVVINFKNGRLLKGNTSDFFPNRPSFHITRTDGTIEKIDIEKAKALFFVKDFGGDKDYVYNYKDTVPGGGKKVEVEFNDGEKIIGFVLGYSAQRQGFVMNPADISGNNERIYVINSAVKKLSFL